MTVTDTAASKQVRDAAGAGPPPAGTSRVRLQRVRGAAREDVEDWLAVESPLELRIARHGDDGPALALSVTMRTPGHDAELALGFLYAEGLIESAGEVAALRPCAGGALRAELNCWREERIALLGRSGVTHAGCGACGKQSIAAVTRITEGRSVGGALRVDAAVLSRLPARLRAAQATFEATGGLHACALFDASGTLLALREDVGRHNALDKLVGHALAAGWLPLGERIVLLSGRASYELVQKAVMAGVGLVAAIGAPSSLAVDLARNAGVTLVGFLGPERLNIYSGGDRIAGAASYAPSGGRHVD